jgi:hypothetical protein
MSQMLCEVKPYFKVAQSKTGTLVKIQPLSSQECITL